MALPDGHCGLRRDYFPLFSSLRGSLRLQEPCDTVAQLTLLTGVAEHERRASASPGLSFSRGVTAP